MPGDDDANLDKCRTNADAADAAGAQWIALQVVFAAGVAGIPSLTELGSHRAGCRRSCCWSSPASVHVGGSRRVRDTHGRVSATRSRSPVHGELVGWHAKDLPPCGSALYTGGADPGLLDVAGLTVGDALCWEMLRRQTLGRLADMPERSAGGPAPDGFWFQRRGALVEPPASSSLRPVH